MLDQLMQGTFRQDSLNILSPFLLYLNLHVVFVERLGFPLSEMEVLKLQERGRYVYISTWKKGTSWAEYCCHQQKTIPYVAVVLFWVWKSSKHFKKAVIHIQLRSIIALDVKVITTIAKQNLKAYILLCLYLLATAVHLFLSYNIVRITSSKHSSKLRNNMKS